jgi:hypothetical protein
MLSKAEFAAQMQACLEASPGGISDDVEFCLDQLDPQELIERGRTAEEEYEELFDIMAKMYTGIDHDCPALTALLQPLVDAATINGVIRWDLALVDLLYWVGFGEAQPAIDVAEAAAEVEAAQAALEEAQAALEEAQAALEEAQAKFDALTMKGAVED